MEEMKELDSRGLVRELVKRAWIIVLCVAVGAIGALVFTKNFIKPTYKSGVTFYVNNNTGSATAENGNAGNSVGSENLAVALKLSKSYEVVIQKESVLEDIRKLAGLPVTGAEISKMISAEVIEETEIFQVDIVCKNKNMAYNIAKAIEEHAPGVIMKIIGGSKAEVVDAAKMPKGRFAPNYTTNTILGGLAGGLLAVVVIAVFLITDNRIREEEDLTYICQLPVLGAIPDFSECSRQQERAAENKRKERRRA